MNAANFSSASGRSLRVLAFNKHSADANLPLIETEPLEVLTGVVNEARQDFGVLRKSLAFP